MKTEQLIAMLAQDEVREPAPRPFFLTAVVLIALVAPALLFLGALGLRADFDEPYVGLVLVRKLSFALSLGASALWLTARALQPGRARSADVLVLLAPALVLATTLTLETSRLGFIDWSDRMMGQFSWRCALLIVLLGLAPIAALLWAGGRGAPENPARAGLFAGLASAGFAAAVYALHCTDDSSLFVALWYGLAALALAVIGAFSARKWLTW
jgi:hypothetical protein